MNLRKKKERFIDDEIWILTFGGALQRANVYTPNVPASKKKKFRQGIKDYLQEQVQRHYTNEQVDSGVHTKNIKDFCDHISKEHSIILLNGRLRIGVGQKLFNLHLKYLWCLGKVKMPPHCPFDRIIISKLGMNSSPHNWTYFDNLMTYKKLVNKAQEISNAKKISIAEWELTEFRRR